MVTSRGEATWTDTLKDGSGSIESASFEAAYSFAGRFEEGPGVSPEELIVDAHAGCYSMALAGTDIELVAAALTSGAEKPPT